MSRAFYTKEEERIIKDFAGKKTAAEIGLILGRPRWSVLNKACAMKVSLKQRGENHQQAILSDLQAEMVKVLSDAGYKADEIHQACFPHVSRSCVYNIAAHRNRTHVTEHLRFATTRH